MFKFAERIEDEIGRLLCPAAIVLKAAPRDYRIVSGKNASGAPTPVGVESNKQMVPTCQEVAEHVSSYRDAQTGRENCPLS